MKVKTHSFGNIKKGMELIKEQYGPDTIIMGIKENSLDGQGWSKKACEISIVVDDEPGMAPEDFLVELRRGTESVWQHTTNYFTDRLASMENEMIRDRIKTYPLTLKVFFDKMQKNGFDMRLGLDLLSEVYARIGHLADNSSKAVFFLRAAIAKRMTQANIMAMEGPIVVLGPTGAGKTETVKKMAKIFADRDIPVAILAFDPVKRSSYDELLGFSEDTGIPFQFTTSLETLLVKARQATEKVIVDLTGQIDLQQKAARALAEFKKVVVMPAGVRDEKIEQYVRMYQGCNVAGFVFSKLDEEERLGSICSNLLTLNLPVCFMSKGVDLDDILSADKETVARMLIEGVI